MIVLLIYYLVPLHNNRLYNLSHPEREAMEKYIAGIIQSSSFPLGAGFFFVSKKGHTLHLCIDFCGLNQLTVKNMCPLPLVSPAFEQGTTVFPKLDLQNTYHLVRERDEIETSTVHLDILNTW